MECLIFRSCNNMSEEERALNMTLVNGRNFEQKMPWFFLVLEVTLNIIVVLGDISLLFLYFTRKLLGQATNILVFSVAVGDLMTAVVTMPLDIAQKFVFDLSPYLCKSYYYFSNVAKTAIAFSILFLATERILASLDHTLRPLSAGRCLFFTSLIWFFAASYNIWSVVLYHTQYYVFQEEPLTHVALCFISIQFMHVFKVFVVLDFLVMFLLPSLGTLCLFVVFVSKKTTTYQPGRPYRPSISVIVFTFALYVCFVVCHFPLEVTMFLIDYNSALILINDASAFRLFQLFSFSRGFWDLFIFGTFRHYICRKEKVLAQMRDQRAVVQNHGKLSLEIPVQPYSTSLLDSDQEISQRMSSGDSRR